MSPKPSARGARMALLAAAAFFSTGGAAIKACSLSGWSIAGLRSGIAGLFLFLVAREGRRLRSPFVWLVGSSFAATMILFVLANRQTTAASTVFLQSTAPLYALVFGRIFLGEKPRRSDGWTFGFLGLALALFLSAPGDGQETAPNPVLGNLLAATAGITWGATLTGLRKLASTGQPTLAAVVAGNTLAFLFAFAAQGGALFSSAPQGQDLLLLSWLGVFQIGMAYVLVGIGLRATPVFLASLLLLAEPVLSPFFAWLVHGEIPALATVLGGALVIAACIHRTLADEGTQST